MGDPRRTRRLVEIASQVARRPGGKVTEVFTEPASREAAFRFVESDHIGADEITAAACRATGRRCRGLPFVYVPVDQTDVRVTDTSDDKSLGRIGDSKGSARGLQVMSGIAIAPDGTPIGICGQAYWARPSPLKRPKKDRRPVSDRETVHWLEVIEQTRSTLETGPRPWFQLDRAGDAWPLLLDADWSDSWLTVRSRSDRRLQDDSGGERAYLWDHVGRQSPLGIYDLCVTATQSRKARVAAMQLQGCEVTIDMQLWPVSQARIPMPLWAVRVHEVGTNPEGEDPIEWLLLTTHPLITVEDARDVVLGYATRWRIEEFHKLWKSGACRVEETQLQDRDHIERWATILASAAMRLLRLTYFSRNQPKLPATVEMTRPEIDAVILLRKPKGIRRGATPTIGDVVRWIADLGGYTGKSSGGPPGALVITRGLDEIRSAAKLLSEGDL